MVRKSWIHLWGLGVSVLVLGCSVSSPATSVSASEQPTPAPSVSTTPSSTTLGQHLPITAQATMGGEVIQLEVAETQEQQALGLMFRTEVPDDHGMLFPFDPPREVQFWMRNVSIDLDMVFLRDGKIVAIAENVPPCVTPSCPTYGPREPVDQVIELGGGRAAELGLTVGDEVEVVAVTPSDNPTDADAHEPQ